MSFEYYVNKWIVTKKKLENETLRDDLWRQKAKPVNDRLMANLLFGDFYARYCLLYQELDTCIDQMVQPQKRQTVKKLVDAAAIRLLEFNNILLDLDLSEYHYIDGTLVELKLVPYDVEILHPSLFHHRPIDIEDMWKKIQKGEKIFIPPPPEPEETVENLENIPKEVGSTAEGDKKEEAPPSNETKKKKRPKKIREEEKPQLTEEELEKLKQKELITEAVKLIQTAERGRQERLYFLTKWLIYKKAKEVREKLQQQQQQKIETKPENQSEIEELRKKENEAALKIQSAWRGFTVRRMIKHHEIKRRHLIGMYEPVWRSEEYEEIFNRNLEKRREYRDQRIREYVEAIDNEKARVFRVIAPGLMEDIGDEIREWFALWYKEVRQFDEIPPEEKGGTILVVRAETMTPKEFIDEVERKRRQKVKAGGAKAQKEKERKEKEKLKKAEAEKKKKEIEQMKKIAAAKAAKKKKRKPGEYEYDYEDPVGRPLYLEGQQEHGDIWDLRNDFDNPLEKHYMDIITDKTLLDNQFECRRIVDNMMRVELDMLNEALDEDRVKYGLKKIKRKKRKGKKGKKKKKGKKDLTGNREIQDLFQELVDNEIIRTYPKVSLEDFHGDFSYNNWEFRNMDFDPPAQLLDVRQAVVMNCIIPLGVETMKRPKSVLILGPEKSGKHLLANAIFNATRSVVFDLSPERLAGKYEGGKGMKMLVHLIDKMTKLLAPSIIYFDAAEKPFYKKVPKEEKYLNPKRIGSKIKKIMKGIKITDRVLVLGITNKPWSAQAKLKKVYERHILIPRTDYNSVYIYWRELLMKYPGVDRNFNVTALSKVTQNYPLPLLREALEHVLTPRRIIQLHFKPLVPEEIYEYFVDKEIQPITDKIWKKFQKWFNKTNLGKRKAKFNKWAKEKREALQRKAK
ncbi:dynein regulatory complex protein 11-like [Diorhabda carinulata]|uniref:dynein regulatory complex protein 11-like n=1 Tax=Diorhabda carinulata TaxID=1163345 RepID=UPI0025A082AD|nr:dynein regulatory complex protein 11-like [Diorhabda carinulata]